MTSLTSDHKDRKQTAYWDNLIHGVTSVYKAKAIDCLIKNYGPKQVSRILDFGSGTSPIALTWLDALGADLLVCADYDAAIANAGQESNRNPKVQWRVADILQIKGWEEKFDLVFLLDMVHEVYSFAGRIESSVNGAVDHAIGQQKVEQALQQISSVMALGGGVIITDNILCPENVLVTVRLNSPNVVNAIKVMCDEYKCRDLGITWVDEDTIRLMSHNLCIVLTQYNKIKAGDMARWNVEKLEIHQYMTMKDYESVFLRLGMTVHAIVGTPDDSWQEWTTDFTMIDGMESLPQKRVNLIAIKG